MIMTRGPECLPERTTVILGHEKNVNARAEHVGMQSKAGHANKPRIGFLALLPDSGVSFHMLSAAKTHA
jgi:hypothetical protein